MFSSEFLLRRFFPTNELLLDTTMQNGAKVDLKSYLYLFHNFDSTFSFFSVKVKPNHFKKQCSSSRTTDAQRGNSLSMHGRKFTPTPKFLGQPHRPNFSDIFDLCLHWVSVVRVLHHNFYLPYSSNMEIEYSTG